MEILKQHVGVQTSFPRHGEVIAELHRKLFDQRMIEKARTVQGIEGGVGVRPAVGDQLRDCWNSPGKEQWGSEQCHCSGRKKHQGQDLMALSLILLPTSASSLMNQVGCLSHLCYRGHCWLVHGNTCICFIFNLLGHRGWQISRTTEPALSFIIWQNDCLINSGSQFISLYCISNKQFSFLWGW